MEIFDPEKEREGQQSDAEENGEPEYNEDDYIERHFTLADLSRLALAEAVSFASFDDVLGVVSLQDEVDPEERVALRSECKSLEELQDYLRELYEQAWASNGPDIYLSEDDRDYGVNEYLESFPAAAFFKDMQDPEGMEALALSREFVADSSRSSLLRVDLQAVNAELIRYLAANPHKMRDMEPRLFEKLVAELFKDMGYDVTITPQSRDGGIDILAVERSSVGAALTLVECKRYAERNRVGVDVVRGLYGVVEQRRATRGVLVTSSYFTRGAQAFRDEIPYRLGLADFDVLSGFLSEWRQQHKV